MGRQWREDNGELEQWKEGNGETMEGRQWGNNGEKTMVM